MLIAIGVFAGSMSWASKCVGQTGFCGTSSAASSSINLEGNGFCSLSSANAFPGSPCKDYSKHAPIVASHTPIKTLRLVIHVVQQDAGLPTRNFEANNQSHLNWLGEMVRQTNIVYRNLTVVSPSDPVCPSAHIVHSRIQVELESIYFHQRTQHWNQNPFGADTYCDIWDNLVANNNSIPVELKENAFHVFLVHSTWTTTVSGYSPGIGKLHSNHVVVGGFYHNLLELNSPAPHDVTYGTAVTLVHELGHAFGLHHSNGQDYCCDTPETGAGNNIMHAAFGPSSALSQCQLARMHFMLESGSNCSSAGMCSSAWKTIKTDYCNLDESYDIVIPSGSTVVWEAEKKLNTDIIVQTGGQLIIKCKIGLPDKARIIVERGARLIVDGGMLTHNKTMWPRCTSGKWESIIVAGNTGLPHHPDMKNDNYPLQPNDPGIVILRNATIENAMNAISTRSSGIPWPQSENYWGGFIYGENTKFLNNTRSVEFMKYEYPNFSAFEGCQFVDEDGTADYGVTNWACNGILFKDCTFGGLNRNALLVYDGGIIVTGSTFKGNSIGIEGYATHPLASNIQIGNGPGTSNFFEQNHVAVYGNAVNNLFVQNNIFNANVFGVAVHGESQYEIKDNSFQNSWVGIDLAQTGSRYNVVNCNIHDKDIFGMDISGYNWGLQFWRQDFSTQYDIVLSHEGLTPGQILPSQGGQGAARWSYFSSGTSNLAHIYTLGNTAIFNYFHPAPSINPRLRPKCALNQPAAGCATSFNFNNFQATGSEQACADNEPGQCATKVCLDQLRLQISAFEQIGSPLAAQLSEADILRARYNELLWKLVNVAETQGNATAAISLLEEDGGKAALRGLVGLRLKHKQYALAQQALSAFPLDNADDAHFVAVQGINLRRLSEGETFVLNQTDETSLYSAVASREPASAYAKGLLSLLKGEDFKPELPDIAVTPQLRATPFNNPTTEGFRVYPVPARGQVTIEVPQRMDAVSYRVEIFDLYGRSVFATSGNDEKITLGSSEIGTGVFHAVLWSEGRVTDRIKFVMIR